MKRRIVKHGEATMTISLPSKWIKKFKLNKGDEIDIKEKENQLILSLEEEKWKSETSLTLHSNEESSVRTMVTNAYRMGFDKIHIQFKDKKNLSIIKEVVERNLLGFEIIQIKEDFCLIENITEPSKEQFDNIFSKVFLNTEELFDILESKLQNKEIQDFEETSRKIMQYDNFCRRIIAKKGFHEKSILQWTFHTLFVHATREIYHLLKYLEKKKIVVSKEEKSLFDKTKDMFILIKDSYTKKEAPLLEEAHELEKEISYLSGRKALEKTKNPVLVHYLMFIAREFYQSNSPLMGMIISENNKSIE